MNDNAHFFFFFFGFVGFVVLFCSTIFFFDIISAVINGSLGCLMFAIIGRQMLALLLDQETGTSKNSGMVNEGFNQNTSSSSPDAKNFTPAQS
jgi:hypothetical protein